MMKLTKIHLFSIGLAMGLVGGILLSSISWQAERDKLSTNLDEVRTIAIQTKIKSNKDSIQYNDKIAELAALYYNLQLENLELRERFGISQAKIE